MSGLGPRELITEFAEPLIKQGVTGARLRLAIWKELGLMIGGGGAGVTFPADMIRGTCAGCGKPVPGGGHKPECLTAQVIPDECPYCGATGNGGHGGLCPNG